MYRLCGCDEVAGRKGNLPAMYGARAVLSGYATALEVPEVLQAILCQGPYDL
jgi:hypothetical protein